MAHGHLQLQKQRNILETMKNITIVEPVVTIKSVLKETDIPALDQLADALK